MPIAEITQFDSIIAAHGGWMCWERLQSGEIEYAPCRAIVKKYDPKLYERITKKRHYVEVE